jgi:two-component system phosphate regulon sensor histidine kinase PhoR
LISPKLIFILLSFYIISAFSWWTYAHCRSAKQIYELQKDNIETLCYKASVDIEQAKQQELFEDSIGMKKYFGINFPKLELVFIPNADPLSNFMIRHFEASYLELEATYKRKLWMYILEGLAIMAIIFWGLFRIYSTFKKDLALKRNQTNFLLSVTHELKTPITAIKLYLETLQKRKLDQDQIETIIKNSMAENERLNVLVENLLLSARFDSTQFNLNLESLNLSELVEKSVHFFAIPRNLKERIHLQIEPSLFVLVDASAIDTIITNLLSNAIKYSPENSSIIVRLQKKDKQIYLSVIDKGPGITETAKKELFNKFYRIGDENTRKTNGTGLGLYIVKNLAIKLGAEVLVDNGTEGGSVFTIRFKIT